MPLFKDCVAKVKVGKVFYNGQTHKPLFPKQLTLNAKKDIVNLSEECFSSIESSKVSQAVKNTFTPTNTKYSFPIDATKISESSCKMWEDIGNSLI